jgi:DedD protein
MSDSIDGLKQRLVGAFVILTLAIIFLPMIFDKPHVIGNSKIVPVPPRPDMQTVVVKKAEKPEFKMLEVDAADNKVKSIQQIKSKPAAVPAQSVNENKAAVEINASKPKVAKASSATLGSQVSHLPMFKNVWMVQLGTFGDSANAYRLRDKLRKDGYDSHTKPVTIKGKKSVRVFSGPFVNKREAERTKKKLDEKYRVNSLVLFFDP